MTEEDAALLASWRSVQDNLVLQSNDLALSTLANMVSSGTIDVAPKFQRRDRWSSAKQAALIESFLINLPIPPVYLAEEEGGSFSVIDGRQRLTAITTFLEDNLTLHALDELPELHGYKFSTLPADLRSALMMRPLRSVTLMRQTGADIKYLVFHRLNTAGDVLNAQEIRNVIYRGPLNDALYRLSENVFLRQQLKIDSEVSSAYRKMQDIEFVLRFLTLTEVWNTFTGDFGPHMDTFMERYARADRHEIDGFTSKFERAITACEALWGDHAFHRPEGAGWRTQSLAGLYDAEMVAMTLLSDSEIARLKSEREKAVNLTRSLFSDADFDSSVRTGTNAPAKVRYRIETLTRGLASLASEKS